MKIKNTAKKRKFSPGSLCFGAIAVLSFFLILGKSDVAIEYMGAGLSVCAKTIIPSLFPFMVISELLISSGIGELLGRLISAPSKFLFGVSGAGSCAFFLGLICGFPIGAKTAASMYEKGMISREEFEHLLTFSNNPSSAFLISAVGISLFSDKNFGLLLYGCTVLSAGIIGIAGRLIFRNKNKTDIVPVPSFAPKSSILQFTSAVQSAARGIITVCAYVIFFSAFVGCLGATIREMGVPEFFGTVMFGFFELTSGVCSAAAIGNFKTAAVLCAFFAGWSGLSVHFQIMCICADKGISFRNYFLAKLCQGILCAGLMILSLKFIYTKEPDFADDVFLTLQGQNIPSPIITKIAVVSALIVLILLFAIVFRNKTGVNKKRKN